MMLARRSVTRRVVIAVTGAAFVISLVGTSSVFRPGAGGTWTPAHVGPTRAAGAALRTLPLRLFYTPPILVRRGERVVMPVDVICATDSGIPCASDILIGAQAGKEGWRAVHAKGGPVRVDLSAPAARAGASGAVRFYLRATDGAGAATSLGAAGSDAALRFYVTDRMAVASLPQIRFGDVREGQTVLALPWGTGPMRTGLELGNESDTVGPTSFDVDADGRIFLLDGLQRRLALFADGRLAREVSLPGGPLEDVAAADDGSASVLSRSGSELLVRRVDAAGSVGAAASLGQSVDGHVEIIGAQAFADLFPLDAWVAVPAPGGSLSAPAALHAGRPISERSELLRSGRPDSIRVATVVDGVVNAAVEIRSSQSLGEVELAEPDGGGGYWIVVHVWQEHPVAADQYEVVHVRGPEVLSSFAVGNDHFANVPPLNRFRLARDGFLYQMTSSPEGIRLVRYELGGNS